LVVRVPEQLQSDYVLESFEEGAVAAAPLLLHLTWHDMADYERQAVVRFNFVEFVF